MKLLRTFLMIMLGSIGLASAAPVEFDAYDGYFVSNEFEPKEPTSFQFIKTSTAFEKIFRIAYVMRDKAHRLPKDSFNSRWVVAVVHRGKSMVYYKVDQVEQEGNVLVVKYATKSDPSESAEFSCPLILSVPKGKYTSVRLVEDGKEVKVLNVKQD